MPSTTYKRWSTKPLAEVCQIIGGGTPPRSDNSYFKGTIPWATAGDITSLDGLLLTSTKEMISDSAVVQRLTRLVPKGTVLLTTRATIGAVAVAGRPLTTNQDFANLICSDEIHNYFLAWYLISIRQYLRGLAVTTTISGLQLPLLKRIQVPIPPLQYQKSVAQTLNELSATMTCSQEHIDQVKHLIPALFHSTFGNPEQNPHGFLECQLGDIIDDPEIGWSPQCLNRSAMIGEFGVLKVSAVSRGFFDPRENKALPADVPPRLTHLIRKGDLLFNRANSASLIGMSAVVTNSPRNLLLPDKLWRITPKEENTVPFVQALLSAPGTRRRIRDLSTGTSSSMLNISKARLLSVRTIKPPRHQQLAFSRICHEIYATLACMQQREAELKALLQSLLIRLFHNHTISPTEPSLENSTGGEWKSPDTLLWHQLSNTQKAIWLHALQFEGAFNSGQLRQRLIEKDSAQVTNEQINNQWC